MGINCWNLDYLYKQFIIIYIYIYKKKTEIFETPIIFHVNIILKNKTKILIFFFLKLNNTKTTGIIYDRSSISPQSSETLFLSKNQNLLLPPKIQNQNPKLRMRKKEEPHFSPSDKPRKGTWHNDAKARILDGLQGWLAVALQIQGFLSSIILNWEILALYIIDLCCCWRIVLLNLLYIMKNLAPFFSPLFSKDV